MAKFAAAKDNRGVPMKYGTPEALHIGAHEGVGKDVQQPEGDETSGLSFFVNLGLQIGDTLKEHSKKLDSIDRQLQKNTPVFFSTAQSGMAVTGQPLVLNLGTPDQGTQWEVNFLAIGGTDVNVAAAGTAGVYVTGNGTGTNTGGLANIQDYAAALPKVDFYSQKQLIVNSAEYLIVNIFGGTNAQTYIATAQITVYDLHAAGGRTVITE